MPTVRAYGGRKVVTDPLVGARKSAAETPTSMGAGVAEAQGQTAAELGRLAGTVTEISTRQIAEERDRADSVALQEAETKLGEWENKRLLDPQTGAYAVKGKDAMPLPEQVGGEFKDVAGALEAGLSTDRQRAAFQSVKARRAQNLDANLRRHVFGEMQTYEAQTLQATEENASESAAVYATDHRRVGEELTRGIQAIQASGPRLGLSGPVLEKRLNDFTTRTYVGVIDRLVAEDNVGGAKIYFEEAKAAGQITGAAALAHVTAALKVGDDRAQAQKVSDTILAAGGTLTEQRDKVRSQLTGEARDRAMSYIEHEAALKESTKRAGEEHLLDTVYARLKRNGGDLHSITAAEELALGSHLPGLTNYAQDLARGTPRTSDKTVFYTMLDQAEQQPANFATLNLRPLLGKLDEQDYDRLDRAQRAIRAGDKKAADKELDDFRTERDVIKNALTLAGLDPSPKPDDKPGQERLARFQTLVATEVQRVQDVTGKKATNDVVDAIANRVLAVQITDKGWFSDSTRSLMTATPADIPATDRAQILDSLRRHGQPATPEAALAVWLRAQARKGGP